MTRTTQIFLIAALVAVVLLLIVLAAYGVAPAEFAAVRHKTH